MELIGGIFITVKFETFCYWPTVGKWKTLVCPWHSILCIH